MKPFFCFSVGIQLQETKHLRANLVSKMPIIKYTVQLIKIMQLLVEEIKEKHKAMQCFLQISL